MDTRIKEMAESLEEIFQDRFEETCSKTAGIYREQASSIKAEIVVCVEQVLHKTDALQQTDEKGEAAYFAIGFLRSSLNTGHLCVCMEMLEDILYLDEGDTKAYYYPDFLQELLTTDMDFLKEKLQVDYVRIKPYELEAIQIHFIDNYTSILLKLFKDVMPEILAERIQKIRTASDFKVVFNDYMQEGMVLFEGAEVSV